MYSKIAFSVKIDAYSVTDPIPSSQGVLQGCLLSPLLFSLFINDIIEFLDIEYIHAPTINGVKIHALLYADDLVLLSSTKVGLQHLINRLSQYCKLWLMQVNVSKTKVMVFKSGGGKLAKHESWHLDGKPLEVVKHFKYLGLTLSSNGMWFKNQEVLNHQALKSLFQVKKILYTTPGCPIKLFLHIFDTAIAPIILYGSEICGLYWKRSIEKIQLSFLKYAVKVPRCAPNAGIYLELGRIKLKHVALSRSLSY